jgi:hypothetical protein
MTATIDDIRAAISQIWKRQIEISESEGFYSGDSVEQAEYDELFEAHGVLESRLESMR